MASHNGHHDIVQTLLGAGADVNKAISDVSHVMFYYNIREMSLTAVHAVVTELHVH